MRNTSFLAGVPTPKTAKGGKFFTAARARREFDYLRNASGNSIVSIVLETYLATGKDWVQFSSGEISLEEMLRRTLPPWPAAIRADIGKMMVLSVERGRDAWVAHHYHYWIPGGIRQMSLNSL